MQISAKCLPNDETECLINLLLLVLTKLNEINETFNLNELMLVMNDIKGHLNAHLMKLNVEEH